jgi:hypothetical protein
MAMSDQTLSTIIRGQVSVNGKKRVHFGLDRMRQKLASPLAKHVGQQVFEFPWPAQGDNGIVSHGVSLLSGDVAGSSPPRCAASSHSAVTNFRA